MARPEKDIPPISADGGSGTRPRTTGAPPLQRHDLQGPVRQVALLGRRLVDRGIRFTVDLTTWQRLHHNAVARATAEEAAGKAKVRPAETDTGEGESADERTEVHQPRILGALRKPVPPPESVVPTQPDGLLALVQQFMDAHVQLDARNPHDPQRGSSLTVDHVHTALALCTTPQDALSVMRELVADKGLTIGELERRSRRYYPISGATFAHMLNRDELPTIEWLNIFLRACGVDQERNADLALHGDPHQDRESAAPEDTPAADRHSRRTLNQNLPTTAPDAHRGRDEHRRGHGRRGHRDPAMTVQR